MKKSILFMVVLVGLGCNEGANEKPVGIANPASVYCVEQGGISEIRTTQTGAQAGVCKFKDGTECEEWAFNKKECVPGTCVKWNVDNNDCEQKK